jgi:hypothetical protein
MPEFTISAVLGNREPRVGPANIPDYPQATQSCSPPAIARADEAIRGARALRLPRFAGRGEVREQPCAVGISGAYRPGRWWDEILADDGSLGTPTNSAIQKYLNSKKVPHILVSTGAAKWNDPKNVPWTTPNNYATFSTFRLAKFDGKTWKFFGENIATASHFCPAMTKKPDCRDTLSSRSANKSLSRSQRTTSWRAFSLPDQSTGLAKWLPSF